jgi:DNA processing protein
MSIEHWLTLALTDGIGPISARRLIEATGSAQAACAADETTLRQVEGIGSIKSALIRSALPAASVAAQQELVACAKAGVTLLCPDDERYPLLLKEIPDPPLVLYVRGTLEARDLNAVAIVGSRKCSLYGREQAERFGFLLAGAGFTVVSGGARGIDSAAHRGALTAGGGRTIAVLGCGIDIVYPPENAALFEQIAAGGAIISEFPLSTPPLAEHFPRRNRLVSGLSRGTLVIEADERSGALITARQAVEEHGRSVFALPGRVDNRLSIGPHRLIREGAALTSGIEDIIDVLGPLPFSAYQSPEAATPAVSAKEVPGAAESATDPAENNGKPAGKSLSSRQELILKHLTREASPVDLIIDRCGLDAGIVLQELTYLTLHGLARRIDGAGYARRK